MRMEIDPPSALVVDVLSSKIDLKKKKKKRLEVILYVLNTKKKNK